MVKLLFVFFFLCSTVLVSSDYDLLSMFEIKTVRDVKIALKQKIPLFSHEALHLIRIYIFDRLGNLSYITKQKLVIECEEILQQSHFLKLLYSDTNSFDMVDYHMLRISSYFDFQNKIEEHKESRIEALWSFANQINAAIEKAKVDLEPKAGLKPVEEHEQGPSVAEYVAIGLYGKMSRSGRE